MLKYVKACKNIKILTMLKYKKLPNIFHHFKKVLSCQKFSQI